MIFSFSTKRDRNGNRYFLGLDTIKKEFSRNCKSWYGVDDLTAQITKKERLNLIHRLESENFKEVDYISLY